MYLKNLSTEFYSIVPCQLHAEIEIFRRSRTREGRKKIRNKKEKRKKKLKKDTVAIDISNSLRPFSSWTILRKVTSFLGFHVTNSRKPEFSSSFGHGVARGQQFLLSRKRTGKPCDDFTFTLLTLPIVGAFVPGRMTTHCLGFLSRASRQINLLQSRSEGIFLFEACRVKLCNERVTLYMAKYITETFTTTLWIKDHFGELHFKTVLPRFEYFIFEESWFRQVSY